MTPKPVAASSSPLACESNLNWSRDGHRHIKSKCVVSVEIPLLRRATCFPDVHTFEVVSHWSFGISNLTCTLVSRLTQTHSIETCPCRRVPFEVHDRCPQCSYVESKVIPHCLGMNSMRGNAREMIDRTSRPWRQQHHVSGRRQSDERQEKLLLPAVTSGATDTTDLPSWNNNYVRKRHQDGGDVSIRAAFIDQLDIFYKYTFPFG